MSNPRTLRRRWLGYAILATGFLGVSGCSVANQVIDTLALVFSIVDVWA